MSIATSFAFLLSSFDFLHSTFPVFPHACSVTNGNSRDILTLNYANAVSEGNGGRAERIQSLQQSVETVRENIKEHLL